MYRRLIKPLRSQTAKDASAMTVGTAAGAILALGFFIIAARTLGPEKLGILFLATTASFMFADIFDVALNTSLVRFVAAEIRKKTGEEEKFLKFIFKLKLGIGIALLAIIGLLATPLSTVMFGRPIPEILLLIGLGTGFQLIFTFSIAHLQARKDFIRAAGGIVMLPGVRLLAILALLAGKRIETLSTLAVYFFSTPIAAATMLAVAPRSFFKAHGENQVARTLLKYNLPLTVGFAIAAVASRIDNFILANLSGSQAVGYYAAAFRLFTPLQFLAGSLSTVFAPRFAGFERIQEVKTYLGKTILAISLMSLGLLAFLPFSRLLIQLFYGVDFLPSVSVLRILFLGFAVFLMQAPFTSVILYYLSKPRVFALVSGLQLILVVAANLVLIPRFQQNGAAIAFLITQLAGLAMLSLYALKKLQKVKQ